MSITEKSINKKALVVTTVASTIDQFCMNDISILQKEYRVHVAANFESGNNTSKERVQEFKSELKTENIVVNEAKFNRSPFSKDNYSVYKEIKSLIARECYDIVHCHTPVAALVVRLATRKVRKKGTKVIYTAHGFHFFEGAPIINWLLYYPLELFLARYTDVLITINNEDYNRAKKSFKAGSVEYIPGVGIDVDKFVKIEINKKSKRKEMEIPEDVFIALSVGELNKNKNHETVIRALAMLNNPKIHYVICGQGLLESYLKNLIKELGLEKQVHLLGFRKDIAEICKTSDVFVFPSKREGLGLAALEAMACGLPIVTSNVHGILDYSINGKTGFVCSPTDVLGFAEAIGKLFNNNETRSKIGQQNIKLVKKYDINNVKNRILNIYKQFY